MTSLIIPRRISSYRSVSNRLLLVDVVVVVVNGKDDRKKKEMDKKEANRTKLTGLSKLVEREKANGP